MNVIDPDFALGTVSTLDKLRDRSRAGPADMASQFAKIGGLALIFSGVGLYSAMAYAVGRRTQEIAVTQSGLDLYFDTRPKLPADAKSNFAFLRRSAWDAAVSGGTLRLIDFDVAAALSDIYVTPTTLSETPGTDRSRDALSANGTGHFFVYTRQIDGENGHENHHPRPLSRRGVRIHNVCAAGRFCDAARHSRRPQQCDRRWRNSHGYRG